MTTRKFQDYADSSELKSIAFKTDEPVPTHKEGLLAYDPANKSHLHMSDIPDTVLNVGQEQIMRVINMTGGPIAKGKAVRHAGVDPTTELPKIQLALADSIVNARILGVITETIDDGDVGLLTTFGVIPDVDTSLLSTGVPVYLSDSSAGDFVEIPPGIVTQIGGVLRSDALTGKIFISIYNTISLPTLFGILQDIPDTYNLTTTYQDLTNYQVEDSVSLVLDKLNGTIIAPNDGRYRGTFNISLVVPTLASTRTITIQAWDVTHSLSLFEYAAPVPRDTTDISRSFAVPFSVVANSEIVMRVKADVSITGVTIPFVSYDIESISLT